MSMCLRCGVLFEDSNSHQCEDVQIPPDNPQDQREEVQIPPEKPHDVVCKGKPEGKTGQKECIFCSRLVPKSNWARHMESHLQQKRVQCNDCLKKFSSKCHLKRHFKSRAHARKANSGRFAQVDRIPAKERKGSLSSIRYRCDFCKQGFFDYEGAEKCALVHRNERAADKKRVEDTKEKFRKAWETMRCCEPGCKNRGCESHLAKYQRMHVLALGQHKALATCNKNRKGSSANGKSNPPKPQANQQPSQPRDIEYGPGFNLECNKCSKRFRYPSDLKAHIRGHAKDVQCRICHRKYKNRGSEILICTQCRQTHGTHGPVEQLVKALV